MKFQEAELPAYAFSPSAVAAKFNVPLSKARDIIRYNTSQKIMLSETHQVNIREVGRFIHLSIKRIDKEPEHDWRILQDIKNSVLGPEFEAVELYPAESRLIDTSNQFHLWALKNEEKFDIGWNEGRTVGTVEEATVIGAKQRAYDAQEP
jgi:hypothetical protein